MLVDDRQKERNYELNGSRKEHKEAKMKKEKPWPLEVIGLGAGLRGAPEKDKSSK